MQVPGSDLTLPASAFSAAPRVTVGTYQLAVDHDMVIRSREPPAVLCGHHNAQPKKRFVKIMACCAAIAKECCQVPVCRVERQPTHAALRKHSHGLKMRVVRFEMFGLIRHDAMPC